ncbi:hypothetical protein MMC07_001179 [Pseudocyphellaria aurata]|nr:hypothetical protein [Pseudocyphellaria aurata]
MVHELAIQTVKHGQHIFLYNNIRTNQVLYSFTRALNNHDALKQIPFLGKKTVPAKLRKDLWQPFAMVEFTNPLHGVVAYRKLREFRRLHETSYPLKIIKDIKSKGRKLIGKKERGKVLMNQKANSVADLAAVLLQQAQTPTAEQEKASQKRVDNKDRLRKQKGSQNVWGQPVLAKDLSGVTGVRVWWANKLDSMFAKNWPETVVHDNLMKSRHTAAFPPLTQDARDEDETIKGKLLLGEGARPTEESLQTAPSLQ